MKNLAILLTTLLSVGALSYDKWWQNSTHEGYTLTLNNVETHIYFSPKGGATQAVVNAINNAKTTIYVQAYSFTSAPISQALIEAKERGIHVEALLDKSNVREKFTQADALSKRGIHILIDDKHAIAHNKIIIIDKQKVITGSFNFSKAAEESNAENLLILNSRELADIYAKNYEEHKSHSVIYTGKE